MLCERCTRAEAGVLYRETECGRCRSLWLCRTCADTLASAKELEDVSAAVLPIDASVFGEEDPPPLPITSLLSRAGAVCTKEMPVTGHADRSSTMESCPLCGMTAAELVRTGQVGCAVCYRTFRGLLSGYLRRIHGATEHRGRYSAGYRARQERLARLTTLRGALKEAVIGENFEEAAILRDEIRRIEAEAGGV